MGAFFLFVLETSKSTAEVEAIRALTPKIQKLDDELDSATDQFQRMKDQITAAHGNILEQDRDLSDIKLRAEKVLEGLNKAEGSLAFGREMLELKSKILWLESLANRNNTISDPKGNDELGNGNSTLEERFNEQ